ncbi:MAG TPA: alpha/beta hydrolase [Acidimicrobiales bacterium]|nr:alpha/beta hydrolase [Acidimicrobiales bacterium]
MTVDPTTRTVMETMARAFPDVTRYEAAQSRRLMAQLPRPPQSEPVHKVTDSQFDGPAGPVPVRIYRPTVGLLPVVVFCHGGGWVLCNLDTHDDLCRSLANGTGAVVVSVDYRQPPEHPFPAAVDDAYGALQWVAGQAHELGVDQDRMAVAGDSAGGNLAAAVCLMAWHRSGPSVRFQLLIYPVLAHAFDTGSYLDNATGYFLTAEHMRWYWDQYLADPADGRNQYASPLFAEDLSGLPAAHIITGEHDPLRDEGEAYAGRLREAGVDVTNVRYGGMFHGFFTLGRVLPAAAVATSSAHAALRAALEPKELHD